MKRPQEMVDDIFFAIRSGANARVKNPLADAAFMAQIGAKLIREANDSHSEYELKNAATGTRFKFYWSYVLNSHWRLRKVEQ